MGNYVFGMYFLKLCCIVFLMSWVGMVGVVIIVIGGIGFGLLWFFVGLWYLGYFFKWLDLEFKWNVVWLCVF